ncbi:MAG: YdcF family protein [Bacteroidota bacterium]
MLKRKWLKRSLGAMFIIAVLHFGIIIFSGLSFEAQSSDMLVILGSQVKEDGIPSKRLRFRLDKGFELFQQGQAKQIIVSGGIGIEGFDEAAVMAQYLIDQGVDSAAIIRDNQGNNTFLSAKNCQEIMAEQGAESIIIVSQYFHLLRSRVAFQKIGIQSVSAEAADLFYETRDFYSIPREVIGLYYYLVRDYEAKE